MHSWCNLKYLQEHLQFYTQPIVDLQSKQTVGYEMLARLNVGDKVLSPHQFLSVLESEGLYPDLDEILGEVVVSFLSVISDNQFVSINIPSVDSLMFHVNNPKYKNICHRVHLELLESVEWSFSEQLLLIEWASKRGFEVYLDDFGSGFSNIKTLTSPYLSGVKIDRTMFNEFFESDLKVPFSKLLVFLKSMGNKLVLEGVETAEQTRFLTDLDSEMFCQGFLYGKPESIECKLR